MKRNVNMLSGSIVGGLLALALPVIVMNVLQSLFTMVDMKVLKEFAESADAADISVGAIGAASFLITLVTSLVFGVSTGANVVIARNIGRNDREAVSRSVGPLIATLTDMGLSSIQLITAYAVY